MPSSESNNLVSIILLRNCAKYSKKEKKNQQKNILYCKSCVRATETDTIWLQIKIKHPKSTLCSSYNFLQGSEVPPGPFFLCSGSVSLSPPRSVPQGLCAHIRPAFAASVQNPTVHILQSLLSVFAKKILYIYSSAVRSQGFENIRML